MTSSLTIITDTRSVIVSGDNLVLDLRSQRTVEQCDVESSALRASSAVKVGATNSPDGAHQAGRFDSGSLTEIVVKPQVQVLPGDTNVVSAKGDPTGMGWSDGVERHAANSDQQGINGPLLPVEAATEKQAACLSRPIDSQVLSEPADNAGEAPSSSPASPAPLSKADMVRLLRPHCQHPGTDLCAGSGRSHCHACRGNSEVAA
jgi:hypothetical protein